MKFFAKDWKKVGKLHIAILFAVVSISSMLGPLLSAVPVHADPTQQFGAWVNAGTIQAGDPSKTFYDSNPLDNTHEFDAYGAANCSYPSLNRNFSSDRLIFANWNSKGGNTSVTEYTVDTSIKDAQGQEKCEATTTHINLITDVNEKYFFYQSTDTATGKKQVFTYDGKYEFDEAAAKASDGSTLYFANSGGACADLIVQRPSLDWEMFPMAQKDDPLADQNATSEQYGRYLQDEAGSNANCRVASAKIQQTYGAGNWETTDVTTCDTDRCTGPPSTAHVALMGGINEDIHLYSSYPIGGGDDWYVITSAVGGSSAAPPAGTTPPAASSGDGAPALTSCDASFNNVVSTALKWIVCPIITLATAALGQFQNFLDSELTTPIGTFDNAQFHEAWNSFRVIALGIVIIAALVMVISQALGLDLIDAYTTRKMLPALLAAAIFIGLSWDILEVLYRFSADTTVGVRSLIYAPFGSLNSIELGGGSSFALILVGTGATLALGPFGLLTFVLSGMVAVLLAGVLVLMIHVASYMLLIIAPVAIACAILPNTRKAYHFWRDSVISILIAPIAVSAMLAILGVAATVLYNSDKTSLVDQLGATVIFFGRYFFVYEVLKRIGGLVSTLTGGLTNKASGLTQGLKNLRKNTMANRHKERMEGRSKVFGSAGLANAYRRVGGMPETGIEGLKWSRRGRSRYRSADQRRLQNASAQMLKQDEGRSANDDNATAIAAQAGMTSREFIRQYSNRYQAQHTNATAAEATTAATNALTTLEDSMGGKVGTSAMQVAAFRAWAASPTAISANEDYRDVMAMAAPLISSGLLTHSDATNAVKANKARGDVSAMSWNTIDGQFQRSTDRYNQGLRGAQLVTNREVEVMKDSALESLKPGEWAHMRPETADALLPRLLENLDATYASNDPNAEINFAQQMGQVTGLLDQLGSANPLMARRFANGLNSRRLNSTAQSADFSQLNPTTGVRESLTVREIGEVLRGGRGDPTAPGYVSPSPHMLDLRREYGNGFAAAQQQVQQGQQQQGQGQQGAGGGGSDRRIKRDIHALGVCVPGTTAQLYRFKYLWSDQEYVGVMAQDILESYPEAVSVNKMGYYQVDYTVLGTLMYTYDAWLVLQKNSSVTQTKSRPHHKVSV